MEMYLEYNTDIFDLRKSAKLVHDTMNKKELNILDSYAYVVNKYNIIYSFEDIKNYLFHHNF